MGQFGPSNLQERIADSQSPFLKLRKPSHGKRGQERGEEPEERLAHRRLLRRRSGQDLRLPAMQKEVPQQVPDAPPRTQEARHLVRGPTSTATGAGSHSSSKR